MTLVELVETASSEEKAEKFLRAKDVIKNFICFPFCGNKGINTLEETFSSATDVRKFGT